MSNVQELRKAISRRSKGNNKQQKLISWKYGNMTKDLIKNESHTVILLFMWLVPLSLCHALVEEMLYKTEDKLLYEVQLVFLELALLTVEYIWKMQQFQLLEIEHNFPENPRED